MTKAQIKRHAKEHGIKATWDAEWKEWNIEGYCTDCDEDAAQTIDRMIDMGPA